jgi:hypothetical protein
MDLHAPPFDMKIELLLQFFDDAFADVAERSDIIGIDLNGNGHRGTSLLRNGTFCLIITYNHRF